MNHQVSFKIFLLKWERVYEIVAQYVEEWGKELKGEYVTNSVGAVVGQHIQAS